jgi:Zn ribbon nucleic-acid-binding protein
MSIPTSYIGVSGDRCSCGRRVSIRHCPACGSFRVQLRRKEGKDSFVCVPCGMHFDDEMRKECQAPVYRTKQEIALLDIIRAKQEHNNGHPLTEREELIIRAIDPLTQRYKREEGSTETAFDVQAKLSNETNQAFMRQLAMEYATLCLKMNQRATSEGREKYIADRLKEIAQIEKMQQ